MDMQKSGQLIADARKELGLTQAQLAEAIGVTDKAISRWETGRGFPDVVYLQPLSKTLGISITEIVSGEITQPESDVAVPPPTPIRKRRIGWLIPLLSLALFKILDFFVPVLTVGLHRIEFWIVFFILTAEITIVHHQKLSLRPKVCQCIAAIMCVIAFLLQALPLSAIEFRVGPNWIYQEIIYRSCFDPYLITRTFRLGPFLSGTLTITVLVMMGFMFWGKRNYLRKATFICTLLSGFFMSFVIFRAPTRYITLGTVAVILLLFSSAIFQARAHKKA